MCKGGNIPETWGDVSIWVLCEIQTEANIDFSFGDSNTYPVGVYSGAQDAPHSAYILGLDTDGGKIREASRAHLPEPPQGNSGDPCHPRPLTWSLTLSSDTW